MQLRTQTHTEPHIFNGVTALGLPECPSLLVTSCYMQKDKKPWSSVSRSGESWV